MAQVTDHKGVAGQNSPNPESLFGNHQIVSVAWKDPSGAITELFYDPSYGLTYTDMDDMEDDAIDGYCKHAALNLNEATVGVDLDGDGRIDSKVVFGVESYVFCTNDSGGHLDATYLTY